MNKKKQIIILVSLIIILLAVNYPWVDSALVKFLDPKELVLITRVIDGDTIVTDRNVHIRLLGINTPEKGEKFYSEAKEFLEERLLNKEVFAEGNEQDRYYRELRYIFSNGKNVNLELVREGFANVYILDDKKYENELRNAWESCIKEENNLCEKSKDKCGNCIELKKLDVKSQEVVFENICEFDCDLDGWIIKDEGRKKFVFEDFNLESGKEIKVKVGKGEGSGEVLFWNKEDYVWTATGDSLFLRDKEGKLVLWEMI